MNVPAPSRSRIALGLVGLAAVSALLRTGIAGTGYWTDEGLTVGIADASLLDLPVQLSRDGSPPLYYALLHGWMAVFGDGESATHALSLLFALAGIPAAWWAARAQLGERVAWVAAALAATNSFLTEYAQETRPYALAVLLSLLLAGAYLRGFVGRDRRWLAPTALLAAAIALTHHWGLHMLAGLAGATAVMALRTPSASRRAMLRDGSLVALGAAALYAPWLPLTLAQVRRTGAPWSTIPGPAELADVVIVPLGGVLPATLVLASAAFAVLRARRSGTWSAEWPAPAVLAAAAALAFSLAFAGALMEPGWAGRYLAALTGPLLLAAAWGLGRAGAPGAIVLGAVLVLWAADGPSAPKSNVRELAASFAGKLDRRDLVIAAHPEQVGVMRYYLGARPGYATTLGPQTDPRTMDWRDALRRLRAADPAGTLARVRAGRPGRVLLMLPVNTPTKNRRTPWIRLVRQRARAWQRLLDADPGLRRVAALPGPGDRTPPPRGIRAVLYEPL